MGETIRTVVYTVELVPETRDFEWGANYVFGIFTIFPNLFWSVHPTFARGLAEAWLTASVAPFTAAVGGSIGFSFIAEAWLNFGWAAPVVMGVFGFVVAQFSRSGERGSALERAAIAAAFAFLPFYARSVIASVARSLVWYALVPYILSRVAASIVRPRSTQTSGG